MGQEMGQLGLTGDAGTDPIGLASGTLKVKMLK